MNTYEWTLYKDVLARLERIQHGLNQINEQLRGQRAEIDSRREVAVASTEGYEAGETDCAAGKLRVVSSTGGGEK